MLVEAMFEDYSERLFAHYVNGRWRAPFGCDAVPVATRSGEVSGQIVPAGARDLTRALQDICPVDHAQRHRLAGAVAASLPYLTQAIATQSWCVPDETELRLMSRAISEVEPSRVTTCVMGANPRRLVELGQAIGAGLGHGVIWCPPPEMAIFATAVAQIVAQSDLRPGGFALLHANAATREHALEHKNLKIIDI